MLVSTACVGSSSTETRELHHGGDLSVSVVSVSRRIRTVEVRIGVVSEPTVSVMSHDGGRRDVVPLVGHDSDNGLFGDVLVLSDGILPLMKERVIQRAQSLCTICRHQAHSLHVLAPTIMKRLEDVTRVVNV